MKTPYRDGHSVPVKIAATAVIAAGVLVALNEAGFGVPAHDRAASVVIGRAESDVDNSDGTDGDAYVIVTRNRQFLLDVDAGDAFSSLSQADIGQPVVITGENTVARGGGDAAVVAGVLMGIEADGKAWVEVAKPFLPPTRVA